MRPHTKAAWLSLVIAFFAGCLAFYFLIIAINISRVQFITRKVGLLVELVACPEESFLFQGSICNGYHDLSDGADSLLTLSYQTSGVAVLAAVALFFGGLGAFRRRGGNFLIGTCAVVIILLAWAVFGMSWHWSYVLFALPPALVLRYMYQAKTA